MPDDGVRYLDMSPDDNAIVRSVPMRKPDGGMRATAGARTRLFRQSQRCRPSSARALPSPCCRLASR